MSTTDDVLVPSGLRISAFGVQIMDLPPDYATACACCASAVSRARRMWRPSGRAEKIPGRWPSISR